MTTTYTTRDGDTVDFICWRYYGTLKSSQVEAVLAANPGLADQGVELPAGVKITLPVVTPQATPSVTILG